MPPLRGVRLGVCLLILAALIPGCSNPSPPTSPLSPTSPTPPAAAGLSVACPDAQMVLAPSAAGVIVTYSLPSPAGGRAPATVSCAPASGDVFPVGPTRVTCTATDTAAVTATCAFDVNVQRVPQLTRTKFLAFGDSVTAGEVTVPTLGGAAAGRGSFSGQVVLPMAAYPAVLQERLTRRYSLQRITVENAGVPKESAAAAVPRFRNALRASRPDVVLLLQGYNDLGSPSSRRAASSALEEMAKEARGAGARLFMATLTPSIPGRDRAPEPSAVLAMNDAIRSIAAGERAGLVDLYQAALPNLQTWIGIDGLHPTEAGYAGIADTFFAAINADLETR